MKKMFAILIGAALLCVVPLTLHWSPTGTVSVSVKEAMARVGRPLTPMSVAGVNRRAHRRAYYYNHNYYGSRYYYHGRYYYR